jgi:hypothetical protein
MSKFKPGDLVRVKMGTYQEGMPEHRVAVIIEEAPIIKATGGVDKVLGESYPQDIMQILFLGETQPLNFHVMFLEHFTAS